MVEVILWSLVGGVVSLSGGLMLIANKYRAEKLAVYATPFAAGALLTAAFVDLLPEAAHKGDIEVALKATLAGVIIFFFLERFLRWFHHHHSHLDHHIEPEAPLVIIGDTIHNFIDGVAIAAGFLVDTNTGIAVTLAVAAHEIPQEIGDMGLLLQKGMSRMRVALVNIISALATTVAAIGFYRLGQGSDVSLDLILGLVAGFFVYIAASDIIPSINRNHKQKFISGQTITLLAGVIIVYAATTYLHQFIDIDDHDEHHSTEIDSHDDDHDDHQPKDLDDH